MPREEKMPKKEEPTGPLSLAITECQSYLETHGLEFHEKLYLEVKWRMQAFRKYFPSWGIQTTLLHADEKYVRVQAIITNQDGNVIGSGLAEEIRGPGAKGVNKTSAVENGETSAIGRALSSMGLAGGEYASANEMAGVKNKEENLKYQKTKEREAKKEEANKKAEDKPAPKTETVTWSFDKTPTEWVDQAITAVKGCEDIKDIGTWSKLGEEEMVVLEKAHTDEYARLQKEVNKVAAKLRKPK